LSNLEKVEKLKILSKVVRRYRRKIKNIRKKIKQNSEKLFSKYLNKKLTKTKKAPKSTQKSSLSLNNMVLALKKMRYNPEAEFSDDTKALENLITLIASGTLRPDSMQFKIIATQLRGLLEEERIKRLDRESKISINLPEKNMYITKKELEFYKHAGEDESIYRAILGIRQLSAPSLPTAGHGGLYDQVLERLMNKNMNDSDEFCNNLFNTDIANSDKNVFMK